MDAIKQDLAEVQSDISHVSSISPLAKFSHDGGVMSFDATTREGAEMLIKAELLDQRELKELINGKIKVRHIFAKPIEDEDEHGEPNRYVRMVIFDESGAAFSCGSRGVLKSLSVVFAIRGAMPWNPPVACTVKQRSIGDKRIWMTLEPDIDSLFPPSHADKKK